MMVNKSVDIEKLKSVDVMYRSSMFSDWDWYYTHWDMIQNGVYHSGTPLTCCDLFDDSDGGLAHVIVY